MDFVTNRPESTNLGCTVIWAMVNQFRKMVIYLPCQKDIDSPELTCKFFKHISSKHCVPNNIVSDCETQCSIRSWIWVCSHMSNYHWLLPPVYLETGTLSEQHNQTIEQRLWFFSSYEQVTWAELLLLAEFVYNNSVHTSTRMTLFWAMYHRNPEMTFKAPTESHLISQNQADAAVERFAEMRWSLWENILEVQQWQMRFTGGTESMFNQCS